MTIRTKALSVALLALIAIFSTTPLSAQRAASQLSVGAAAFDTETEQLTITGTNFTSGGAVSLNGFPLPITVWTDTTIVAMVSSLTPAGTYLLTVASGPSAVQFDTFEVTIGAVGPKGDKGEKGEKGDKGEKGEKGDTGEKGETGDKGEKGDTGAKGDTGEKGEPGAKGDKGDKGDRGDRGDKGDRGEQGLQGIAGNLALANRACIAGDYIRGFDAQGGLICARPVPRPKLALCGPSGQPISEFIPDGVTMQVVNTCTPANDIQAMFVTRDGRANVAAAALKSYLNSGGIVITEWSASHDIYNRTFGTSIPQPNFFVGPCKDQVNPLVQLTPNDPFWTAMGPFVPEAAPGCGYDISNLPNVTPLGSVSSAPGTVTLGYVAHGAGRLWLVETDWTDNEMPMSSISLKMMKHMVLTR